MLGAERFSGLLWQKVVDDVDRVGLTVSVSPPPSHYSMETLLNSPCGLCFAQPKRAKDIGDVPRLNFIKGHSAN